MKVAIWKNPSNPSIRRAYLNAIPALPKEAKAFIQPKGQGSQLVVRPDTYTDAVLQALQSRGVPSSPGEITKTPFSVFEGLAAKTKAKTSKKPAARTLPPHLMDAGRNSISRTAESNALELMSIEVPEPVSIVIDHREPKELFEEFEGLDNVELKSAELAVGDMLINDKIVIERKCCTGNRTDLEASIVDDSKRLFFQSEKLKLTPGIVPVVILEGPAHENSRSMLIQQIDGAISFLVTIQQIAVLNTLSLRHTAYTALKLAVHERSGLGYELGLRPKKPKLLSDQLAFVLEGVPGISATTSKALANRFPTLAALTSATQAEIGEVSGMGPKRVAGLWSLLHGAE